MTRPAARPGRLLGAFLVCGECLDPDDPDFVRVFALNAVILLLGAAGPIYALFNGLVIGTAEVQPLVVFDLAAFATAAGIGVYLRRTRDTARSAVAADLACLVAFVLLVALHAGAITSPSGRRSTRRSPSCCAARAAAPCTPASSW